MTKTRPAALRHACAALALALLATPPVAQAALYISIIEGLGGMPEYAADFRSMREKVVAASESMTDADKLFTFSGEAATRTAVLGHFADLGKKMQAGDRAAIYLLGHGSFDGETYKFNIPGPDLTHGDLKDVLEKLPGGTHFLVSTGSASGALVEQITGAPAPRDDAPARPAARPAADAAAESKYLLIAGTRNGNERNATQFGRFFADALTVTEADLNKNNSISIQEAFDYADGRVSAYFQDEGKLATEHAQLRGDGAAQFNLSRLNALQLKTEIAEASGDDAMTRLIERRQQLDAQIEELQLRRNSLSSADYLAQLQSLVLQAAEVSEQIDAARGERDVIKPELDLEIPAGGGLGQ